MSIRRRTGLVAAAVLATTVTGCSGNPAKLQELTASLAAGEPAIGPSSDPPVEVYSRVARGALKCWFGPDGSLKATHVFHARVDPPSAGGAAEIAVHTREAGSNHGVLRAYGILIRPAGEGSAIEIQNVRFPDRDAELMRADVAHWIAGKEGCAIVGTGGWNAGPKPAAAETPGAAPVATVESNVQNAAKR